MGADEPPQRQRNFFEAIVVGRGLNLVGFGAFRKKTKPPSEGVTINKKKVVKFCGERKRSVEKRLMSKNRSYRFFGQENEPPSGESWICH